MIIVDKPAIEKELKRRINEGKHWLELGEPITVTGLETRNCKCEASPIEFLDDKSRVERHGLGFRVTIYGSKTINIRLNVRVRPEAGEESPPYVVVYVVNQKTGADDELIHEHFDPPADYALAEHNIHDWYRTWLDKALRKDKGKMFATEMRVG
jgi:hypothetical protein